MKHATVKSYVLGFLYSLLLTLGSYFIVTNHLFADNTIVAVIIGFALLQFGVQLFFFLHLGGESRPRWKAAVFYSTIGLILVIIVGSLWIMNNLNYNMTAQETNQKIFQDEGISQ
jgi:cytochrome o ubiquinol oxidase operon protein cyoD